MPGVGVFLSCDELRVVPMLGDKLKWGGAVRSPQRPQLQPALVGPGGKVPISPRLVSFLWGRWVAPGVRCPCGPAAPAWAAGQDVLQESRVHITLLKGPVFSSLWLCEAWKYFC